MIHFSKKNFLLLLLASSVFIAIYTMFAISGNSGIREITMKQTQFNGGLSLFYDLNSGSQETSGSIFKTIIMTLVPFFYLAIHPFIYSSPAIRSRMNNFDYMIEVRYSKLKKQRFSPYLNRLILTNFTYSFIFFFVLLLIEVTLVNIFYAPFYFHYHTSSIELLANLNYYLSSNGLLNFLGFLFLSPLGCALFSTLVLVIGLYLRNYIVYCASGLVLGLFFTITPSFLGILIKHSSIIPYTFYLQSLLTPGQQTLGSYIVHFNAGIVFLLSFSFYLCLTLILYLYRLRLDKITR